MLDAGRKQVDPSLPPPVPRDIAGVASLALHIQHAVLELEEPSATPRIGERVELEVGFGDRAIHLHEHLYGIRDGSIETVWPVAARGRHQ